MSYSTINPGTSMMVNTLAEEQFFLSLLKPDMNVLEWGAGLSSLAIAPLVKTLTSIEHDADWVSEMAGKLPSNAVICHIAKNKEEAPGDDGTKEDYFDYINYPNLLGEKYSLIFIDGRARVECAKVAVNLLEPDGIIVLHDYKHFDERYRRREYEVIEEFLEPIGHEHTMWAFKPKQK